MKNPEIPSNLERLDFASKSVPLWPGASAWQHADSRLYSKGPWNDEADKVLWVDHGSQYPCMIRRGRSGAWCGYVGLPKQHAFHGMDYDDAQEAGNLDVHGGLTYAKPCEDAQSDWAICHPSHEAEDDVWWLGFDCAHGMDFFELKSDRVCDTGHGLLRFVAEAEKLKLDAIEVEKAIIESGDGSLKEEYTSLACGLSALTYALFSMVATMSPGDMQKSPPPPELHSLADRFAKLRKRLGLPDPSEPDGKSGQMANYRDVAYVKAEVDSLAKQLLAADRNAKHLSVTLAETVSPPAPAENGASHD